MLESRTVTFAILLPRSMDYCRFQWLAILDPVGSQCVHATAWRFGVPNWCRGSNVLDS